jgi:hypothetical protein
MTKKLEDAIIKELVLEILSHELSISVYDGGGFAIRRSRDPDLIISETRSTDADLLHLHKEGHDRPVAWLYLVWGNDASEMIADASANCEQYTAATEEKIRACEEAGEWSAFLK